MCEENILLLTNPRAIPARLLTAKSNQSTDSAAWGISGGYKSEGRTGMASECPEELWWPQAGCRMIREPVLLSKESRKNLKIHPKKNEFSSRSQKKINWGGEIASKSTALLKVCWGQEKHVSVWCQGAMCGEKGR